MIVHLVWMMMIIGEYIIATIMHLAIGIGMVIQADITISQFLKTLEEFSEDVKTMGKDDIIDIWNRHNFDIIVCWSYGCNNCNGNITFGHIKPDNMKLVKEETIPYSWSDDEDCLIESDDDKDYIDPSEHFFRVDPIGNLKYMGYY